MKSCTHRWPTAVPRGWQLQNTQVQWAEHHPKPFFLPPISVAFWKEDRACCIEELPQRYYRQILLALEEGVLRPILDLRLVNCLCGLHKVPIREGESFYFNCLVTTSPQLKKVLLSLYLLLIWNNWRRKQIFHLLSPQIFKPLCEGTIPHTTHLQSPSSTCALWPLRAWDSAALLRTGMQASCLHMWRVLKNYC